MKNAFELAKKTMVCTFIKNKDLLIEVSLYKEAEKSLTASSDLVPVKSYLF